MSAITRAVERSGSQAKLADAIGVTQGLVSQWVNGAQIPLEHFPGIQKFTGISPRDLLDDEIKKHKKRSGRK